MAKRICLVFLALCMLFLPACSSFSFQNVNELLRAPALAQGQGEIQKALAANLGVEPQYIFPKEGEERSPLIMADLDGDGKEEGVLLYTYASAAAGSDKGNNVYVAVMTNEGGTWTLQQEVSGPYPDVSSYEVVGLLGNGTKQIIISYANSTLSSKIFTLYKYQPGGLSVVYQSTYSHYDLADFTGRGGTDLLVMTLSENAGLQLVYLPVQDGTFIAQQVVQLDAKFESCVAVSPSRAQADDERLAVVDGVLDNGMLASQFVYFKNDKFFVVDDSGRLLSETARGTAAIPLPLLRSRDVDDDAYVEIPQLIEGAGNTSGVSNRGFLYIEWMDFITVEEPAAEEWGILDTDHNVYIRLPQAWRGNVTIPEGNDTGEWQLLRKSSLQRLISVQQVSAGEQPPEGAVSIPGTVDAYLVFHENLTAVERSGIAMMALL